MPIPGLSVLKPGQLDPATLTYQAYASNTSGASSYTFSSVAIGSESSDRRVIVGWSSFASSTSRSISSITIGGVAATLALTSYIDVPTSARLNAGFAIANLPTGTTASVVVNFSGTVANCAIGVWSSTKLISSIPYATDTDQRTTVGTHDLSVGVPQGGIVVALQSDADGGDGPGNRTWTGLTERYDGVVSGNAQTGASSTFSTAQTVSITVAWNTGRAIAIAAAWR